MTLPVALGEHVTYTDPKGTKHEGEVVGYEHTGTVMDTPEGRFRGVRFKIQTGINSARWTITFANPEEPLP